MKLFSIFQRRYNRDVVAQQAEMKRQYEHACRELDEADDEADDPTIPIPRSSMLETVKGGAR